jgi:uncharacterized protein DUF4476
MKKLFTPFLFFIMALTAHAHSDDGIICITNLSPQRITIEVDGRRYSDNNSITIGDLATGYHMVKIYGESPRRNGFLQKPTIIYNKNVYVKPKFYIDIIVNRFGRALVDEQMMNDSWYNENGQHTQPETNNDIPRAIDDETFTALKQTISRESFDDSRLTIAKSIIDQNYFTAAQAKQLVQLFVFESNKVQIAKYMYGKTIDKKNYFVVYSAFTFSKSKEELAEYIRNFK